MAINLSQLRHNSEPRPAIITVYGVPGVGKTSLAASAPSPCFVLTESGLGTMNVPHFPLAQTFEDVLDALGSLYSEPHEFKTVVIDSLDSLEPLIQAKTCRDNGWKTIEEPGYGKGYALALNAWRQYLEGINALRDVRNMTVIQIGHAEIRRFDSPESEPYDRYGIKLHSKASALIQEHSDIVLFANYRISTVKTDVGFNKKVNRAMGSGERVLYASERPAYLAKNRYGLPDALPMEWDALVQAMPPSIQSLMTTNPPTN